MPPNGAKRLAQSPGLKVGTKKKGGEVQVTARDRTSPKGEDTTRDYNNRRRLSDGDKGGKDADIVVVDASVLVHALYKVKQWCRDGREEIIIVPLEGATTHPNGIAGC